MCIMRIIHGIQKNGNILIINWAGLVFLQEISSQTSCKRSFLNIKCVRVGTILDRKGNSNNFFVLNAPEFPRISHFNRLRWLYSYPKYE